jgi:GNAT superfamily N-acetyltransferase
MTYQKITCREAQSSDLGRIVEFQLAMALETEGLCLDAETCNKGVHAVVQNPYLGKYYVAEIGEHVIGSLLIIPEWSDWRNGVVWWIHSVYVMPNERGQGVFSEFYRMIQEEGKKRDDFRGLRLYVDKRNVRAQKVYQKLGMSNHHYELYEWMRNT